MDEALGPTPLDYGPTPIIFIAWGGSVWLLGFETDAGSVLLCLKHVLLCASALTPLIASLMQW